MNCEKHPGSDFIPCSEPNRYGEVNIYSGEKTHFVCSQCWGHWQFVAHRGQILAIRAMSAKSGSTFDRQNIKCVFA